MNSVAVLLLAHLWQSTLFVLGAWAIAVVLRANPAALRFRVWLVASLKFLVPLSALSWMGSRSGLMLERFAVPPGAAAMAREVWEPGNGGLPTALQSTSSHLLFTLLFAVWLVGALAISVVRWRQWRRIQGTMRLSMPSTRPEFADLASVVNVRSCPALLEPCLVGIRRPVLLIPEAVVERLPPEQLSSIVSHELAHLHRRDNVWASVHTVVETLFWFHPAVWVIERRLLDERERACDEDVRAAGFEPSVYAEALLNVCRNYMGLSLPSVAGVTGARLTQRIETIVSKQRPQALRGWKKTMVTLALLLAVGAPVILGAAAVTTGVTPTVFRDVELPAAERSSAHTARPSAPVAPARVGPATTTSSQASPTSAMGQISGIVTDAIGDPLADVLVEIAKDGSSESTLTTRTNGSGVYMVRDLPAGIYTVVFRHDEYITFKREGLIVRPATDAEVNPVLKDGFYGG